MAHLEASTCPLSTDVAGGWMEIFKEPPLLTAVHKVRVGRYLKDKTLDDFTLSHSRHVHEIAMHLAFEMRYKQPWLRRISEAAYLHDLGKIDVPLEVLNKAGGLTQREGFMISKHPVNSFRRTCGLVDAETALMILSHHERRDRTGYPNQLMGDAITTEMSLLAVADVYAALTEDRPYKVAWGAENAHRYINDKGKLWFDPVIVANFNAWWRRVHVPEEVYV